MATKIDEAQVRRVALLGRLELSDEEVTQFSGQLSAIVEYIEKLNELHTDGVEPLAHCLPVHNVLREDVPRPSLSNEAALANAPEREDEYFKVPKILDDNSGA
ncbi:MAG: Asp-tRNA(Asn)/Glu-tRNA(Gln) amidotransferase subunit GatC [Phycisphaerae bacterium]|nr:Asp-tRNA(Asn)/Glu-tRNA(Gln) amidotransferase subunit GatC [Phycisphaerae bacterium]